MGKESFYDFICNKYIDKRTDDWLMKTKDGVFHTFDIRQFVTKTEYLNSREKSETFKYKNYKEFYNQIISTHITYDLAKKGFLNKKRTLEFLPYL